MRDELAQALVVNSELQKALQDSNAAKLALEAELRRERETIRAFMSRNARIEAAKLEAEAKLVEVG